ncbi:hypothetical protein CJ030_MR0G007803 [Morella rubra]|uniref:Uncharacterized protein n=1 Tax=Morella rubra TaxID=262757 RepID=A0A6A1UI83_9ROSI|nr:hypothetical protein CJ030_MR0G007803 [Morella rubra]
MTSMILGGDKQIKSRGTKRVNAESFQDSNFRLTSFKFSSPSDMRSAAAPQNGPQGQWSYPMPAITRSSGNLDVGLHERSISLNSSSAAHAISTSTEKISGSALSFGSPGISTNLSAFNPVSSVNGNFSCFNAINNNENSRGCNSEKFSALPVFDPIHLKKSHVLLNAKGKEVCQDKSLTEKGSEKKSDKTVSDDGRDPLLLATSKLQSLVIKPGVSAQNSSKMLDENDSDLDSPIWKGTLASSQFPFGVSGSASSKCLCKELETSTSLNPLAPQFFPTEKEYALVNTSRSSSFFNSAHIVQPSPLGDYFRSNLRLALGTNAEGSLRGIKDVVHGGSERVPVLAKEHVLSPSSSGVGLITDVTETRQDVSMSLSTPPKRDAQILINAMHDLSELLVQNCSNGSYSLNGYEYDIIQHVINNLYAFSMNRVGQRTPMPESTQTGTLYSPNKSTEHCKSSSMELRVAWTKTMALPQESENNSYHEGKKSCHTGITEKELDSFSSCNGVGAEKSNDIIQVMTNILGENQQIEEDMHQQALVYRDLWLKAEAALCALKYKTCALSMKFDGMDRCKSIQK